MEYGASTYGQVEYGGMTVGELVEELLNTFIGTDY